MKYLLLLLALPFVISISMAHAEEGEGKSAEKEKGAGGEYYRHEATLTGLNTRIDKNEDDIREMIGTKNKTTDENKIRENISEIQRILKDRKENIEKYNKEFAIMKFQFPDKGKEISTKYKHFDENRIKEFEDKVNKLLSNVYGNVKQKYENTKE